MKLPVATRRYFDKVASDFPTTPYKALRSIQNHKKLHYLYGCDENIKSQEWVRYPHKIKEFMTCQESGIYNYLFAQHLGLETILLRLNDNRVTGQSHLAAYIQGRKYDYLLSNNDLERVTSISDGQIKTNIYHHNYTSIDIITDTELEDLFAQGKDPSYFVQFFGTGQQLSSYYGGNPRKKIYFQTIRSLEIKDDYLSLRKSFDLGSHFLHMEFYEHQNKFFFSSGLDNRVLIDPVHIGNVEHVDGKYKTIFVDIEDDLKKRMTYADFKKRVATYFIQKHRRPFINKQQERILHLDPSFTKHQAKMMSYHMWIRKGVQELTKEIIDEGIDVNKHTDIVAQLFHQQLVDIQSRDVLLTPSRKQRQLMNFLDHLCQQHNIKYARI